MTQVATILTRAETKASKKEENNHCVAFVMAKAVALQRLYCERG